VLVWFWFVGFEGANPQTLFCWAECILSQGIGQLQGEPLSQRQKNEKDREEAIQSGIGHLCVEAGKKRRKSSEKVIEAFLDLTGEDPGEAFARTLVNQCGDTGPVFVYNASFERGVMSKLAERFPLHVVGLEGIIDRLVDLLPVARNRYYHPDQHGSWSIKAVLPCLVPNLTYGDLEGVADGNMASTAFREAIAESTTEERRREIEKELLAYCHLDTLAMVRMWEEFRGDGES